MAGGFVSPHSCNMPGCTRETYNGQQGEQCCRTCKNTSGASHGPDCNGKEDLRKALALTAAAGPPPSPRHVPSVTSVSDVARQMAAAGAKPAANSTSAAPSSTAKPAASSPASPFGAAVSPLTSRSAGPEKSAPPPAEAKDTAKQVKVSNAASSDAIHVIRNSCFGSRCFGLLFVIVVVYFLVIYEPTGLVRMTKLPVQTFWNYLRSSRKKAVEEAAATKKAEEAAAARKKTEEEAEKKTETCAFFFGGFGLLSLICSGFL
jgi:hypothetical protein